MLCAMYMNVIYNIHFITLYILVFCLHVYICITCVHGSYES